MTDHERDCIFAKAHDLWRSGDLDAFLELCDENITWTVNMDGIATPYVSSAFGKEDLRWRLIQLGTTFEMRSFDIAAMTHDAESCTSRVRIVYVHRTVGESLETYLLFRGWVAGGHLTRVEETVDRGYVEAYDRLMRYLAG